MPAPLAPITPTMPPGGSLNDEVLDQQAVAEALLQVVGLHHHVAEARARRDVDLDRVELDVLLVLQEPLVRVDAGLGLGLAGAGRHAHPLQLAGQRALARALLLLLHGQAGLLLLQPARVVALEGQAAAAVELQDPAGDVVEEVAIVGHGHDDAGVLLQEVLQPRHGVGVEVVGRLVQQQQVGRREQQPAQRDATALAAGQVGHLGVARRQPQRVHGDVEHRGRGSRRRCGRSGPAPGPAPRAARSSRRRSSARRSAWTSSVKRSSSSRFSRTPSSTLPRTSLSSSSSGSCDR